FYLGATPQMVLRPLFGNSQGWFGPAAATQEMGLVLGLGLGCSVLATAFLWRRTLVRFRIQTARTGLGRPEIEAPGKLAEEAILGKVLATQAPPRRRQWVVGLGLTSALLLLPLAAYQYMDWAATRELRQTLDEVDAAEPGWELKDLEARRAVLPKEQNGAERVLAARALL